MAPFKGGFDSYKNYEVGKTFGDRLSWSNGHPNQRNAKTAVNASAKNRVAKKSCGDVDRKWST